MGWDQRLLCMLAGGLVFSGVIRLLIKRKMDEADSFLWLILGLVAIVSGFFPDFVAWISRHVDLGNPVNLVLVVSVILLIFVVFKNTTDISLHKTQNHELAMQVSMLNSEVRHLIEITRQLSAGWIGDDAPEKKEVNASAHQNVRKEG